MDAVFTQNARQSRSQNKSEAKGCSKKTHSLRTVLFACHVGNICLRCRDVAAGDAADDTAEKDQKQGRCKTNNEISDRRPKQTYEQNGASTVFIGETSENRRKEKLHPRVDRKQYPDLERCCLKLLRRSIKRQDRNHHSKPDQIDKDRHEDDDKRRGEEFLAFRRCGDFDRFLLFHSA